MNIFAGEIMLVMEYKYIHPLFNISVKESSPYTAVLIERKGGFRGIPMAVSIMNEISYISKKEKVK